MLFKIQLGLQWWCVPQHSGLYDSLWVNGITTFSFCQNLCGICLCMIIGAFATSKGTNRGESSIKILGHCYKGWRSLLLKAVLILLSYKPFHFFFLQNCFSLYVPYQWQLYVRFTWPHHQIMGSSYKCLPGSKFFCFFFFYSGEKFWLKCFCWALSKSGLNYWPFFWANHSIKVGPILQNASH